MDSRSSGIERMVWKVGEAMFIPGTLEVELRAAFPSPWRHRHGILKGNVGLDTE